MAKKPAVKEPLTRERIVDRAIALADAEGLEAVTIRRLAQDQGVTPMALYWHFKDKDRLYDGVVERLMATIDLVGAERANDRPWDDRLRVLLGELLVVLRAHPALVDLIPPRIMLSEPGLDVAERVLLVLSEAGFTPEQAAQISGLALFSMIQLVSNEPGLLVGEAATDRDQRLRTKRAALQSLSPDRYPHVVASAEWFVECRSASAYFDLGLELFIAGVRGIAPAGIAPPSPAR